METGGVWRVQTDPVHTPRQVLSPVAFSEPATPADSGSVDAEIVMEGVAAVTAILTAVVAALKVWVELRNVGARRDKDQGTQPATPAVIPTPRRTGQDDLPMVPPGRVR